MPSAVNWDADIVPPLLDASSGIGGVIRRSDADFRVDEVPLYDPEGEGEHLYLEVTREGQTTKAVQGHLARAFDVPPRSVGYAGLKDKYGRCTQRFSIHTAADEASGPLPEFLAVETLGRHRNKLRRGHLLGNRFRIVIRETQDGAPAVAEARLADFAASGLPNWYGLQRFGGDRRNAEHGRAILDGRRVRDRFKADMWLSAWQSALFNRWLRRRSDESGLATVWRGDVLRKTETGGLFDCEEAVVDQGRLEAGEIGLTGPLFGHRMRRAGGEAGRLEEEILEAEGVSEDALGRVRLSGTRRAALVFPTEASVEIEADDAVAVSFTLPKGSFATVVLREIVGDAELA